MKTKLHLEVQSWCVIHTWDKNVPAKVLKALQKDELVGRIHGCWNDLLLRHGDDGGWCVTPGEKSDVYKFLERIRDAVGYDKTGTVFYLVIKTS